MPIRSDHGRNAALRSLATWPLHSRRRLTGTLSALAAASIAVTITISATSNPTNPTSPNPTITSQPSDTPVPNRSGSMSSTSTPPRMSGDPTAIGSRFAESWVTKQDDPTWRARLGSLCTEEFRSAVLPSTTPEQVSASSVTGAPRLVHGSGRSADVTVALDTMVLALSLQDVTGNGDWRVADAQPAR
jgi:hypothetical protein